MTSLHDLDAERAWVAVFGTLVAAVTGGSLLFPDDFYGGFVWQYFWGPVYADANGAACAVWDGGARTLLSSNAACGAASGTLAYPGYTLVSEVGYMLLLLLGIGGVVLLLRRLDFMTERRDVWALLPFVFFGGALRVVEDANDKTIPEGGADVLIAYPLNSLLISPVIYVTVFLVTLAAVVGTVWAARRGHLDGYHRPLATIGTALLVGTLALLAWTAATKPYASFHPAMTALTLTAATLGAGATWWLVERYWPAATSGTGMLGPLVIWGHAVDGAANVIGISWGQELGLPYGDMGAKHPANQAVIDLTGSVLPESITSFTGTVWPFFPLKLAVAAAAVWLFNDEIIDENPRYALLMLLAILAVGLGPGSRDMLRATFGV